jgi:hypothetical protein
VAYGGLGADEPGQARAAAPAGDQAQAHFGQADDRFLRVGRQTPVTGERKLIAAAGAGAVDGTHDRDLQIFEQREQFLAVARQLLRPRGIGPRGQPREVGPGDEDFFLRAVDDHGLQRLGREGGDRRAQGGQRGGIEDIGPARRVIEDYPAHAFPIYGVGHWGGIAQGHA